MIGIILIAGLWPFTFLPPNQARYDSADNTLSCNKYSSAWILVAPDALDELLRYSMILTFSGSSNYLYYAPIVTLFDPAQKTTLVTVGQWHDELIVRVRTVERKTGNIVYAEKSLGSVFAGTTFCTLTTVIDSGIIRVMINDRRLMFDKFSISTCQAMLILGNSQTGDSPWIGSMRFSRSMPIITPSLFKPMVLTVLKPMWKDLMWSRWYLRDMIVNVAGFMPLGFLLALLLRTRWRRSLPVTVVFVAGIGMFLSLTIEILQVYMPYRSSQMSDVVCNTLGSGIGGVLCLFKFYD